MRPSKADAARAEEPVIDLDAVRAKHVAYNDHHTLTLSAADFMTLHVAIAESRVAPDGKWLYVLQVTCGRVRWRIERRYSAIRDFWQHLRDCISANEATCTERCHFLAGFEGDKFPKKHLVHTKSKLDDRASALETFFVKLVLRLNLCSRSQLERCYRTECSLLRLLADFFEINKHFSAADARDNNSSSDPFATLTSYQLLARVDANDPASHMQTQQQQRRPQQDQQRHSMSRLGSGESSSSWKKTLDRRFSFGALRDVRAELEPQQS